MVVCESLTQFATGGGPIGPRLEVAARLLSQCDSLAQRSSAVQACLEVLKDLEREHAHPPGVDQLVRAIRGLPESDQRFRLEQQASRVAPDQVLPPDADVPPSPPLRPSLER